MDSTVAVLPNEQALVARATAEPPAFVATYDHYFPRVYNYVRYRIGDPEMADDITAQVFERALVCHGHPAVWVLLRQIHQHRASGSKQRRHPWPASGGVSGTYRRNNPYLAYLSLDEVADWTALRYFPGLDPESDLPRWNSDEADAAHLR